MSLTITVEDVFKTACSHVDSMTDAGEIDANTTADYRGRTLTLTNTCQRELFRIADNYKQYPITLKPIPNLLGVGNFYDVKEYKGNEDISHVALNDEVGSVQSYYFESDATDGTVYIEDYTTTWNTLATISLSNTDLGFKAYSGSVTKTVGASKSRIRFSGSFYYRYRNVALYSYNYVTVPVYRQWIPVQLPTDLKMIDKVILDAYNGVYTNDPSYRIEWENNRQTLYFRYDYDGEFRIQYKPYPVVVTAFTDLLSVDDIAAECISYFLAMNFVATEQNEDLRNQFRSQYENLKNELSRKQPESEIQMLDFYPDTNYGYGSYDGRGCTWDRR